MLDSMILEIVDGTTVDMFEHHKLVTNHDEKVIKTGDIMIDS